MDPVIKGFLTVVVYLLRDPWIITKIMWYAILSKIITFRIYIYNISIAVFDYRVFKEVGKTVDEPTVCVE